MNAEGVDAADALRLNQTALDAGNHSPDVAEGDARKQEAPEQSDGDAKDCRQDAVAPVLGHSEGGVAELPHPIQAVCAIRLRNDILKLHLIREEAYIKNTILSALCIYASPNPRPLQAQRNIHTLVLSVKIMLVRAAEC